MRSKLLNADPPVSYALVFESGEEVMGPFGAFVREAEAEAASITAIGAFARAVPGYFDRQRKDCRKIAVEEQVEVLSLSGDVAVAADGPSLHPHAVLGRRDGSVGGGHLLEARVRPTLEVILAQPPSWLRKSRNKETRLALLAIGRDGARQAPANSARRLRKSLRDGPRGLRPEQEDAPQSIDFAGLCL